MKTPTRLIPLIQADLIEEVVGQLQSGKEAEVYIVRSGDNYCCAKVYKDAKTRSFKQKTQYIEGRKSRNSRQARALAGKSRFGKQEQEAEWQNNEVDALYLLSSTGVRVPKVLAYYEGVLLLQMIVDEEGNPAPRLHDVELTREQAKEFYLTLMRETVKMLCAGIIHGDLSEYNVLVSHEGVIIIDFPQTVQATANNAYRIFERDLTQLRAFFGRYDPEILTTNYAREIWNLYENAKLKPDSPLTGHFKASAKRVDVESVLREIEDVREEEMKRRETKKQT